MEQRLEIFRAMIVELIDGADDVPDNTPPRPATPPDLTVRRRNLPFISGITIPEARLTS